MFIEQTKLDKIFYEEQRDENPGLVQLETDAGHKHEVGGEIPGDVWSGLFKQDPVVDENAQGPLAQAMREVLNTNEWKALRAQTRHDPFASSVATLSFGKEFIEKLPEDVLKAEQAERDAIAAEGAVEAARGEGLSQEMVEAMRQRADDLKKAAAEQTELAKKVCDGDIARTVRVIAREKLKKAADDTEENRAAVAAWGIGAGGDNRLPLGEQLKMAKKIASNAALRMFAKYAGRAKMMAMGFQSRKAPQAKDEIEGIELGDHIIDALPTELVLLRRQGLRRNLLRRSCEKQVLKTKKSGKKKKAKGSIMLAVDESGSMSGERIARAKGIACGLSYIASKQKRSLILAGFSSSGEWYQSEHKEGKISPEEMERFATHFYGGGTDFEMALDKSLSAIEKSSVKDEADLIFISDGDCSVSEGFKAKFIERKKSSKVRIFAVGVGCGEESFRDFADHAFGLHGKIENDEVVLERVFSI